MAASFVADFTFIAAFSCLSLKCDGVFLSISQNFQTFGVEQNTNPPSTKGSITEMVAHTLDYYSLCKIVISCVVFSLKPNERGREGDLKRKLLLVLVNRTVD